MTDAVLTINAGSSSLKFALFETRGGERCTLMSKGKIEGIPAAPHMTAHDATGRLLTERHWPTDHPWSHEDFLVGLADWVDAHLGDDRLKAVGHRVVHGGVDFARPVRIDDRAMAVLEGLNSLAPLHQPHNLAAIRALQSVRPDLPQIACFDTAFHHDQPRLATLFALPHELTDDGIRRYGFHGLSYEYIAQKLRAVAPTLASGRVIVAHLGNGASLCAMSNGRSIDTTMGFTALDGLMMGTRCGSIDPGVMLYLQQTRGMTVSAVERLLYNQSGLLGVSGESADMRVLLASPSPLAAEAIELFVYRVGREIGALTSVMGGLDGVVFTAGIGENAPEIRRKICTRLCWLGAELDQSANLTGTEQRISTADSKVVLWVLPTDEETMIARHTSMMVGSSSI